MKAMRSLFLILSGTVFIFALMQTLPAYAAEGELIGTGMGAGFGGLFGSQFGHGAGQVAATSVGIVAGGLAGNAIGHDIDAEDSAAAPQSDVTIYNAPPIAYNDHYAPNYVAPPAPPPTYADPDAGTYCREYSEDTIVDGQLHENYGTVCLQPDGSWRITP